MTDSTLIQAVILTKNEEPNIRRVLEKLTWLEKVVVLDSFSTDNTLKIVSEFKNTQVVQRVFDTHAQQWNFGLDQVDAEWVLTLDADYVLTDEFIAETHVYLTSGNKNAYLTNFKFLVFGERLLRDNTTSRPVLFKRNDCRYFDDGHTQRLKISGETGMYKAVILHDDRKSLDTWFSNQVGYSIKETKKLLTTPNAELPLSGKLRKNMIVAPFFVFFYSLFVQGLIFNGWKGWHYTLQRTMVEITMALRLIEEKKLKKDSPYK